MNPNVFQHKSSIKGEGNSYFPLIAVTNLDHAKMLQLAKGEIVGFAHDEEVEMNYIETSNVLEIGELDQRTPRNWIPKRKWKNYRNYSEILPQQEIVSEITASRTKKGEISPNSVEAPEDPAAPSKSGEISHKKPHRTGQLDECNGEKDFKMDFLISPGDMYPNRKVKLEDADITEETREKFEEMCDHHPEAFSKNNKDIGRTTLIEMEIDTGDSLPIARKPYTLPLDYRKVNSLQQEVKRTDRGTGCLSLYPLLKIDEMFTKLNGAKCFSTIDLRSGYYHIGLTCKSRAKSAFVVPMGKWEFKQTPFGLSQAPAYFQLLIDKVLMGCSKFAMGYFDDIIIFSNNEIEHLQHIEEIFNRLERFGLKMKREKCDFFKKHIQYLGHLITANGFTPLPEKLESIRNMPKPKTPKEVKQFLSLIGYYRKFVPRFSDIARSLMNLTRHDTEFIWTEKCDKAFKHLKELLMQHPILRYPDPGHGYILFTDASGIGWAGVLTQEFEDDKGKKNIQSVT